MPTEPHLDPEENALAKLGYETEDVEYKSLGRSIGWFFIFVIFCGVAGLVIFGAFIGWGNLANPPEQTAPFVKRLPPEPNPLLQDNTTAKTDIRDLRAQENAILHGPPAWVDRNKGVVRIPIEKAIDDYARMMARSGAQQGTTMTSGVPPVQPSGGGATNE